MIICDVKSGSPAPWHKLQVAAYALAWKEGDAGVITFDAETHTYHVGDEEIPGVSAILRDTGRQSSFAGMNPFYAQKGTYVHRAIELDCDGKLDETTVDEEVLPYLMAWRSFKYDAGAVIIATEQVVFHPEHRYAGRFDLLLITTGKEVNGAAILYLKKTGKYSWKHLSPTEFIEATAEWLQAVREYHSMKAEDELWG